MCKNTILIDLDDTLTNFVSAWCDALNKKYGTNITEENITEWDISKFFKPLTKDEVFEVINHTDFWKTVKPRCDAIKYTKRLIDDGHEVYICTATYYANIISKFELIIQKYFPFITWDKVIITQNKQIVCADYLIDDNIQNLIGGKYKGILFDTPHNRNESIEGLNLIRAMDWKEVYKIISRC